MAIIRSNGAGAADLVRLARALGREGDGVLERSPDGDSFSWTGPLGEGWRASGEAFEVDPQTGAPQGEARVLRLSAGGFSLSGDAGLNLSTLAGEGASGPGALDAALAGADVLRAFGSGGAALFGDAFRAGHLTEGAADRYVGGAQAGGRRISGDFWTVAAEAAQVFGGADRLVEAGRGAFSLWGDAALLEDRAVADGALLGGGDDRIDASGAGGRGSGAARALIGDAGAVGRNWDVEGGDDLLRGPAGGAALIGDAGVLGAGARLVGGDDVLRGGAGRDALHGEVRSAGPGALVIAGEDRLFGGAGADRIWGEVESLETAATVRALRGGGGDVIDGGAGPDRAWGGPGGDVLRGGSGADRLFGGRGADRLKGGADADRLKGGGGADGLVGGGGRDAAAGGGGDDRLRGGGGADRLTGGAGDDRLRGGAGADRLAGGQGDDRLFGGPGADRLIPGAGRDRLAGGAGPDVFVLRSGDGRHRIIDYEPGVDALSLGAASDALSLRDAADGVRGLARDLWFQLDGVTLAQLEAADADWLG